VVVAESAGVVPAVLAAAAGVEVVAAGDVRSRMLVEHWIDDPGADPSAETGRRIEAAGKHARFRMGKKNLAVEKPGPRAGVDEVGPEKNHPNREPYPVCSVH